jgi:hypothetical protein
MTQPWKKQKVSENTLSDQRWCTGGRGGSQFCAADGYDHNDEIPQIPRPAAHERKVSAESHSILGIVTRQRGMSHLRGSVITSWTHSNSFHMYHAAEEM